MRKSRPEPPPDPPKIGKTLWKLTLGVVYFGWVIAALHRFQDWRNGEFADATAIDWLLLGSLPLLLWVYFRYFSVFGKGKGQCLIPPDKR